MLRHLRLRTKLIVIALPSLIVLAFVAGHGLLISFRGDDDLAELAGDVRVLAVVALAAVLLSTLTIVLVWTSIVNPLQRVTAAADELSSKRLPRLVDSLTDPTVEVDTPVRGLDEHRNDEIGMLSRSIQELSTATGDVADRQKEVVSAAIRELVINLARRSQTLVDRQLEYISSLEQTEQNPARLDELFRLDHLATRMRRNAESLLVLAGAEPTDRRGRSVPMADVARVAVGEIERYRQVSLRDLAPAHMDTHRAVDLAHLLSELMENATQFSPPDVPATVTGTTDLGGGYVLKVVDAGLGMTDEQLAVVNDVLADPPELGLSLTRSLGFLVVAKLADRLEAHVSLAHTPGGGVSATVRVPAHMLVRSETALTPPMVEPTPLHALDAAPTTEIRPSADSASAPVLPGSVGDPHPTEPVRIEPSPTAHRLGPVAEPADEETTATEIEQGPVHAGDLVEAWAAPAPIEPAADDRGDQPVEAPPYERSPLTATASTPLRADELLATIESRAEPTTTASGLPKRRRDDAPEAAPSLTTAGRLAPKREDHGARLLGRYRGVVIPDEPPSDDAARLDEHWATWNEEKPA